MHAQPNRTTLWRHAFRLKRTLWVAGQLAIMQKTNSFSDMFVRYIAKDEQNMHLRRNSYNSGRQSIRWLAGLTPFILCSLAHNELVQCQVRHSAMAPLVLFSPLF